MKVLSVVQGTDRDYTWQTPNADGTLGSVFTSSDPIQAKVWAGDSEAVLAVPAVAWGSTSLTPVLGAPQTIWTIQFAGTDTADLAPGRYRGQVYASHSGRTAVLWDGLVEIGDLPGDTAPSDLIDLTYTEGMLSRLHLSRSERTALPGLISTASDTIRKWCGQRDFNRQTYTEERVAELNGYVALRQMPVNSVSRIRGYPQTVLAIAADPSVNQQAWVSYTTSGDWASGTLAYTGITLNSVSGGVTTTTTFPFANYPTVAGLANDISNVATWSVDTSPVFGQYPTSDLSPPGGLTSQGAMDDDGVQLVAYTEDLSCCRLDNATGFLWVGRHRIASAFGERWGPDWQILEGFDSAPIGRVQVTYDAGFTTIPSPVQLACAELVKAMVERLRTDHLIGSESVGGAGSRAYAVAAELVGSLPRPVLQGLSLYRIVRVH